MSGVQLLSVGEGEGEQRLDRWLRRRFPHLGQAQIERMCRKGEIRLDGARTKASVRVEAGQVLRVPPLPPAPAAMQGAATDAVRRREGRQGGGQVTEGDIRMIRAAVVWQDAHLIAINKPPGLPSQGGSGQGGRHVDALAEYLREGRAEKPRLVHRLDRDTSGLMLLGRTPQMVRRLNEAFRGREVRKIYWAAVAGVPRPARGSIRLGLVKGGPRHDERMHAVLPDRIAQTEGARRAATDYAVLEAAGGRIAWVALMPVTGRTHQLRVHMAEIGHPIAGDGKYGTRSQHNPGDGWGAGLGGALSRQLHLHARSLQFRHPATGEMLTLTAPLPEHMRRTWAMFGWREADAPADPFETDPATR